MCSAACGGGLCVSAMAGSARGDSAGRGQAGRAGLVVCAGDPGEKRERQHSDRYERCFNGFGGNAQKNKMIRGPLQRSSLVEENDGLREIFGIQSGDGDFKRV